MSVASPSSPSESSRDGARIRVPGPGPGLRTQLSASISNSLIHNEEADPETQPLRNSPGANRERFQQNQRTAAQGVVQRSGWVLLISMILITMLFFVWLVFYFEGWMIWRAHRNKKCDQPLANWLLGMLILPLLALFAECCQGRRLRVLVIFLTLLVLLLGFWMFYKSKTCDTTNPELYAFVRQYLFFLAVWWISWVVIPLVFVAVVIYGMWHGWFDELNGASPETIKQVETVVFDADLFAQAGNMDDGKPQPECCICTELFDTSLTIKRTTCQHYFHEDCLGKWLRVSTTCPLCRNDLERSTLGDSASSNREAVLQASTPASLWPGSNMLRAAGAYADDPDAAASPHEAEEVQSLLRMFPDLDDTTALLAVRNSGSAEQAAEILGCSGP